MVVILPLSVEKQRQVNIFARHLTKWSSLLATLGTDVLFICIKGKG